MNQDNYQIELITFNNSVIINNSAQLLVNVHSSTLCVAQDDEEEECSSHNSRDSSYNFDRIKNHKTRGYDSDSQLSSPFDDHPGDKTRSK